MDILDRLLGHDYWTTRHLLLRSQELTAEQWHQPVEIGHGSLFATFDHMIGNIEVWGDLMLSQPVRSGQDQVEETIDALIIRLDVAYAQFRTLARSILAEGRLDELWTDILDDPPRQKSYGGAILHVITHNMGHRSEVLQILQRLGLPGLIEGDLLSWEQMNADNAD